MSIFDYSKSVSTATRLITKFGRAMTLRVETEGAYDPATGLVPVSSADNAVIGVIFELSGRLIGQSLQNDTLASANDKQCLLKVDVAPSLLDKLVVGADTFLVINIKELNPGGTVIFYDLVLRNG
jgi:hypothetical protein